MAGLLDLLNLFGGGQQGLLSQGIVPQQQQSNPLRDLSLGLLKAGQPSPYKKNFMQQLGEGFVNAEEMQQNRQKARGLQGTPAAIQIANEYAKARAAGDVQRMNDIAMAAKSFDKGVSVGDDGTIQTLPGYGSAIGQLEAYKKGMGRQAEKSVDYRMNPLIERATSRQGVIGKDEGEAEVDLHNRVARMPQLEDTVDKLSQLGKKATYTYAGQGRDALMRQAGMPVPDSAVARTEYISMVDNEILPLLRETFGAQFTQKEGESLKVTLGDPNKTPEEKDAVLRSFIRTKQKSLETLERKMGRPVNLSGGKQPGGNDAVSYEEYFK